MVFAGGANSRRWGRAGRGRLRLAQPAPGPEGDIFTSRASPSPAWPVRFHSHATSARLGSASKFPISLVVCPAWPVRFSEYFAVFPCCVSSSRFRCSNVLVSPGPAASLGLALYNRHTKQSLPCPYTGFRIPLVRRGLRSALIRHISSHDKMSRIVILFFLGKS